MPSKIFYVFDETADVQKIVSLVRSGQKIFLCPLTTSQRLIATIEKSIKAARPENVELMSFLERFDSKAFALKSGFLRFISEFADAKAYRGRNLKEEFRYPGEGFSLWWLSLVAEKNPLKSDSYANLARLLTVLDLAKETGCDEVWLQIQCHQLAGAIEQNLKGRHKIRNFLARPAIPDAVYGLLHFAKGWWRCGVIALKSLWVKIALSAFKGREKRLAASRYLLVTYFPFVDEEKLAQGEFVNKFYGPLQRALEAQNPGGVSWLAMAVTTAKHGFSGSVGLGKKINSRHSNLFFLQELVTAKDFLKISGRYIAGAVKFISLKNLMRRSFGFAQDDGRKVHVWPLFRKEFYSSFCGTRLMEGLFYYHAFKNAVRSLAPGTTVIYFAEMQAWEKALNAAFAGRDDVAVVGFQHAILSVLHMMYFNHAQDLKSGNFVDTMPRPRFLASVGDVSLKLFRDSGWPREATFVLGAVRFQKLKDLLGESPFWAEKRNDIIVALSISCVESEEILRCLDEAFADKPERNVFIKPHPFCHLKTLKKSVNGLASLKHIRFVDTPLDELLSASKVAIVAESSAAIEAIACGCRVIVPKLAGVVDMSPLSGISDLGIPVFGPAQMAKHVESIFESPPEENYRARCRSFVERYFAFAESERVFVSRLEDALRQGGS